MTPFSRRSVLGGAAAVLAGAVMPRPLRAQTDLPILRATKARAQIAPDGYPMTDIWSYATGPSGTVPGPEIRVRAGERVRYRLHNELPEATSVHWHGIRIDNAMDGAAPLTQAPVDPGATFDYDFVAPDPGTYWYHSHNHGWEQVARGLAGPLIVEDREAWSGLIGAATREMTLVLDDWLLNRDASIVEDRWDDLHAASHAGRLGNSVTVNGQAYPDISLRPNERVRVRVINTATARIMRIALSELPMQIIALDGHPVAPRPAETVVLGPAQRVDLVIDGASDRDKQAALLLDPGRGDWIEMARFIHDGPAAEAMGADVRPLPQWGSLPNPDLTDVQREVLVMDGGAMRGLGETQYRGETLEFRELVERGMVWAFNGVANGMAAPMFRAARGRSIHLAMTNRTAFQHAIHLHGHHFVVLSRNGAQTAFQDVRDTVLVAPDETVEIAFVADNPGRWMIHCHMLAHQASGMMSWFEVT